jgi:hypothetical protein
MSASQVCHQTTKKMESEKKMSKLQEEIKKLKEKQGGELLKLKDRQTEIVKFDLDENGEVVGHTFEREYKGKKSTAVMFPVTIVNTGEGKNFPLALSWADTVIELVQRKKQPVVEKLPAMVRKQTPPLQLSDHKLSDGNSPPLFLYVYMSIKRPYLQPL